MKAVGYVPEMRYLLHYVKWSGRDNFFAAMAGSLQTHLDFSNLNTSLEKLVGLSRIFNLLVLPFYDQVHFEEC